MAAGISARTHGDLVSPTARCTLLPLHFLNDLARWKLVLSSVVLAAASKENVPRPQNRRTVYLPGSPSLAAEEDTSQRKGQGRRKQQELGDLVEEFLHIQHLFHAPTPLPRGLHRAPRIRVLAKSRLSLAFIPWPLQGEAGHHPTFHDSAKDLPRPSSFSDFTFAQ